MLTSRREFFFSFFDAVETVIQSILLWERQSARVQDDSPEAPKRLARGPELLHAHKGQKNQHRYTVSV
jgi:hypothetical protein